MDAPTPAQKLQRRLHTVEAHAGRVARGVANRVDRQVTDPRLRGLLDQAAHRGGTVRRRRSDRIAVDRLLLGPIDGHSVDDLGAASGNRLWASTRFADGPHTWLADQIAHGSTVTEIAAIEPNPYLSVARGMIARFGNLAGHGDPLEALAHDVEQIADTRTDPHAPLVRPLRNSSCFQVIDGHHELARMLASGTTAAIVDVTVSTTITPVQDCLQRMTWLKGEGTLYQPLDLPELEGHWHLARACTDRLDLMLGALDDAGVGPTGSYLDVASCYGWFVAAMGRHGFEAEGIEIDPVGAELGMLAYDLAEGQVGVGDAEVLLRFSRRRWDVVSCFSFVHHLVMRKGDAAAHAFLAALDRATDKLLVFDTGETREDPDRLVGWDPDDIEAKFRRHTTFSTITRLGVDSDDPDGAGRQFGRTVFACSRG